MIDVVLVAELEEMEGDKARVYPDTNGSPSIGVGHRLTQSELSSGKIIINGMAVLYRNGLTEIEIRCLLNQDLKVAQDAIARLVKVPMAQCQYDSLTSWTFNVGGGALAGSTLLRLLNAGLYDRVPAQMRKWVKDSKGAVVAGLVRRREAEAAMWLGQDGEGCEHS